MGWTWILSGNWNLDLENFNMPWIWRRENVNERDGSVRHGTIVDARDEGIRKAERPIASRFGSIRIQEMQSPLDAAYKQRTRINWSILPLCLAPSWSGEREMKEGTKCLHRKVDIAFKVTKVVGHQQLKRISQPWMLLTLARYGSFEQSINLLPNKLLSAKSGALFWGGLHESYEREPESLGSKTVEGSIHQPSISTALTCTFHLVHRPHESDLALYCPPRKLQTTPLRLSDLIDLTFLLGMEGRGKDS
ncbi:hypothetical protein TIFTF001_051298 [Ficus carica]|uniref:Uncharacterized protein n=1 Tax=Ficus carica TaxID=3494 RepID=A0AA87YUF9_FICCA|nr:hypothetical protein TIFTF001_051298 [Ficus carica]